MLLGPRGYICNMYEGLVLRDADRFACYVCLPVTCHFDRIHVKEADADNLHPPATCSCRLADEQAYGMYVPRTKSMRPCNRSSLLILLALAATETSQGFAPPHQYAASKRILSSKSSALYSSVSETSQMVQGIRSQLAENEEAALVMDALRGKNMNDDDAQAAGVQMRLVDASGSETLKTDYDPKALREFFSKRPLTVISRIAQVAGVGGGWVLSNVLDKVLGRSSPDLEVQRAGELRDIITSLGPFYIKIGQALSIRPDVLSPRSMVELQKLCGKCLVPGSQPLHVCI